MAEQQTYCVSELDKPSGLMDFKVNLSRGRAISIAAKELINHQVTTIEEFR